MLARMTGGRFETSSASGLTPKTTGRFAGRTVGAPSLRNAVAAALMAIVAVGTSLSTPVEARSVSKPVSQKTSADPLLVTTTLGPVQGFADADNTYAWQGIPFAAPPVGNLRWRAPQPAQAWTAVRQATQLPVSCPQLDSDSPTGVVGQEDCLYLNVWRPATETTSPRPVMVFIHGGGNTSGSTDFGMYYGSAFASTANVVLVTVQYRLASLGFLNYPALQVGDPVNDSGNFATLDHIKALEWVRDNAKAFGGDPSRVTIFGESAGGMNTWSLVMSERSQGLFHRAIVESGCPYAVTVDEARQTSQGLTEALVVADGLTTAPEAATYLQNQGPTWVRNYLYSKSMEEILVTAEDAGLNSETTYYAIEDGVVQRADMLGRMQRGDFHSVPMITGANADEMKIFFLPGYFIKRYGYNKLMESFYGDNVADINALYPSHDYSGYRRYFSRFTDIGDWWLQDLCGVQSAIQASAHTPLWHYEFRYDDLEHPYDDLLGACHAAELPFIFQNYQEIFYPTDTLANRDAVSNTMIALWSCMAYTGDPTNCAGAPTWPQLSSTGVNALSRMAFADEGVRAETIPTKQLQKIDYWEATYGIHDITLPGFKEATFASPNGISFMPQNSPLSPKEVVK